MAPAYIAVAASLIPNRSLPIFAVDKIRLNDLTEDLLELFLALADNSYVGFAFTLRGNRLSSLVFATPTNVLCVTDVNRMQREKLRLLQTYLLLSECKLFGAHMDIAAYGFYADLELSLSNGIDAQSLFTISSGARDETDSYITIIGNTPQPNRDKVRDIFCAASIGDVDLKAIIRSHEFAVAARRPEVYTRLQAARVVSTHERNPEILAIMAKLHRETLCLEAAQPVTRKNDVAKEASAEVGQVTFTSERYKTRLRNTSQKVVIHGVDGAIIEGRVREVQGRTAMISIPGVPPARIKGVYTVGKDPRTNAENRRRSVLVDFLHGTLTLDENPAFVAIWFPSTRVSPGLSMNNIAFPFRRPLNPSQRSAVRSILEDPSEGVVDVEIICGPPGTGKTTMIAASVEALHAQRRPVWLLAHSNVAVKNMAQKLAEINFWNFRILVSFEFHFDWHEHLYEKIESTVITSDTLPSNRIDAAVKLGGASVILCTLSMLSNSRVREVGITTLVPVETLIIDEASQISVADYLAPVSTFKRTLRKLVFVGDDRQLAPYGAEQLPEMQSIFEIAAHHPQIIMLDTSYRLPRPICAFISKHMYGSQLLSKHHVTSRHACRFIDVPDGVEKAVGTSWKNEAEANACIEVALRLHSAGKDFKIITPYDPQRAVIEKKLQARFLPWKDTVFCVDSFQGNEAPFIIVSVVRTKSPGFLKNDRRSNVMLTRCTTGMYICAQRVFLASSTAQNTLVGKMAKKWGQSGWITLFDVLNGRM